MESIVFTLLAFLVSGGDKEKRYIFDHVRPEYFEDEALSEIYCAACGLDRASTAIDLISLNEALTTDNDSEALRKRLKVFWSYFVKTWKRYCRVTGRLLTVSNTSLAKSNGY